MKFNGVDVDYRMLLTIKKQLGLWILVGAFTSVAQEVNSLTVAELNFKVTTPWKVVPTSSPMRAGTLQWIKGGVDPSPEAVFYYFGVGQGGDVNSNINRWLGQFVTQPKYTQETIKVGEREIVILDAQGTYNDGPMMGPKTPKEHWGMLGAIVPGKEAPIFIKLTGPEAVLADAKSAFVLLCKSALE
jgi:hypothetical protein